jgi:hypothetical protein
MFGSDSRYAQCAVRTVQLADGRSVSVVGVPIPSGAAVIGYHRRQAADRLDLVATQYLNAPRGFWRLCDANDAIVPAALAARPLIGIPGSGPT